VAIVGAGTVLSYAIVAEYFPKELTGRANGALNVFHFGWAFTLQYAIGLILQQWPSQDGHYPTIAYQVALSFNLGLQIAALAWFELARVPVVRILFRRFVRLASSRKVVHLLQHRAEDRLRAASCPEHCPCADMRTAQRNASRRI
jgi:MFS family permease